MGLKASLLWPAKSKYLVVSWMWKRRSLRRSFTVRCLVMTESVFLLLGCLGLVFFDFVGWVVGMLLTFQLVVLGRVVALVLGGS